MGLLNAVGVNNGFTDFLNSHRGSLTNFGVGLASGVNPSQGIALGTQGLATGRVQDDAYATQQKAEKDRLDAINKTAEFLRSKGREDLLPLLDAGQANLALQQALAPAPAAADPADTATGRQQLADQQGLTGADRATYILTGKLPEMAKPAAPPNGYRTAPDGVSLEFIPGGPADPATASKTTEATRRNQQLAKVIIPEVQALLGPNGDGKGGTFDALTNGWSQGLDAMGPLGLAVGGGPSGEYQQAKNSLKTIIASYLYSVSGATANPGEVETQASVLTPKPGEPQASVDAKKKRVATMVQAVIDAAKGTAIDPTAQDGPASSGKILTYNPATGELE